MTFAVLGIDPAHVAAMFVNALAVGGGFLAGYVLTGVVAYFLDRWLTGGKSPVGLHKTVKLIGGVCGAVLVALIVFGSGNGGGPGGGPGTTASTGAGTGTTAATAPTRDPIEPPPTTPPTTAAEPPRNEETVRVTVLSGADVKEGRFYVVEGGDPAPLSLDTLKRELARRKAATAKALAVEVVLARNADPQGSGAQGLVGAAQDAGARVVLPKSR